MIYPLLRIKTCAFVAKLSVSYEHCTSSITMYGHNYVQNSSNHFEIKVLFEKSHQQG